MYMRMSCVNGCVIASDRYPSRTFFRPGVLGAGVLMHALCLFDGNARNMLRRKLIINI